MTIALWIALAVGAVVLVEGILVRRHLEHRIDQAASDIPIDVRTGLLDHDAFEARTTGELKRLDRMPGHTFWLTVWIGEVDAIDAFGTLMAESLEFPELGFRLDDTTCCFARISDTAGTPLAFAERLGVLSAPWPLAHGSVLVNDASRSLDDLVATARGKAGGERGA